VRADQRNKRERLCRTISRPALSEQRLSLTAGGKVRYQLKTLYNNGTTHVVFEPLDFLARLAALVPRPRVNLTRYHGVFAPNSAHRALVTRAGRGKGRADAARADVRPQGRAPRCDALGTAPEARVRHRRRDLCGLRRWDAHHRVHRRSDGDQGDPRAPGGQSAPGARTAAATRPGAGLKRFTQRHQFKRIFP